MRTALFLVPVVMIGLSQAAMVRAQPGLIDIPIPVYPSAVITSDLFPIRRILIPPQRAALELANSPSGTLLQLSRDEFEARVRAAARNLDAVEHPPRLLETHYNARSIGNALIGSAQWTVQNPGVERGLLSLPSLNLAVRRCVLGKTEAVLGDLDGKSPGLLVEKPGRQEVVLEWSARGDAGPEGRRFDLRIPPCPIASMDLDLAANQTPVLARETGLLIGPLPASQKDRRVWQIYFAGWSQLDLFIREAVPSAEPQPLLLTKIQSQQTLAPSLVSSEFDIGIDLVHGPLRRVLCICPGDLHIIGVSIQHTNLETWRYQCATALTPAFLTIEIPDSFEGNSLALQVRGVAPLAHEKRWHCGSINVVGAILLDETLTLRVGAELNLEDWDSGHYDLLTTSTDKDGRLTIALQSRAGLPSAGDQAIKRRTGTGGQPSARVRIRPLAAIDEAPIAEQATEKARKQPSRESRAAARLDAATSLPRQASERPSFGEIELRTSFGGSGKLANYFRFRIAGWATQELPVFFPPGSHLQFARIDGMLLSDLKPAPSDDRWLLLALPVPAGDAHLVEISYQLPVTSGGLWSAWNSPWPLLPIRDSGARRIWSLPPGYEPLATEGIHRISSKAANNFTGEKRGVESSGFDISAEIGPLWEVQPGTKAETQIIVSRSGLLPVAMFLLGAGAFLAGWFVRAPSPVVHLSVAMAAALAGAVALAWFAEPLARLVLLPLSLGMLAFGLRSNHPRNLRPIVQPGTLLIALAGLSIFFAHRTPAKADDRPGVTVWLKQAPPGNKEAVLATAETLDRLDEIAHRGVRGLQGTVLIHADYEGTIDDAGAVIAATYQLHSFARENRGFLLPLSGVDLLEARLDGQQAFPLAAAAPLVGYQFDVTGAGTHSLCVRFAARLYGGTERPHLRVRIPEVLECHVRLYAAPGTRYLQSTQCKGSETVSQIDGRQCLEADLGRVASLEMLWQNDRSLKIVPSLFVREAHLWDLHAFTGRLFSNLQYTVSQGAPTRIGLKLPEMLEVRRLETSPFPAREKGGRLRQWKVEGEGAKRTLWLDFQSPLTIGVQVFLELVPRRPLSRDTLLDIPTPLGADSTEGLLAFRVLGSGVMPVEYQRITGIPIEEFVRRWQSSGAEDFGPPDRAFTFHRGSSEGPLLRLGFSPDTPRRRCTQEMEWRISATRADLQAKIKLKDLLGEVGLIEWIVPPNVRVDEITGSVVRAWCRSQERIQIWLSNSANEVAFSARGQLILPTGASLQSFDLPLLRVAAAEPDATDIVLTPDDQHILETKKLQNLTQGKPSAKNEVRLTTHDATYSAQLELVQAPVPALKSPEYPKPEIKLETAKPESAPAARESLSGSAQTTRKTLEPASNSFQAGSHRPLGLFLFLLASIALSLVNQARQLGYFRRWGGRRAVLQSGPVEATGDSALRPYKPTSIAE